MSCPHSHRHPHKATPLRLIVVFEALGERGYLNSPRHHLFIPSSNFNSMNVFNTVRCRSLGVGGLTEKTMDIVKPWNPNT